MDNKSHPNDIFQNVFYLHNDFPKGNELSASVLWNANNQIL